MDEDIVKVDEDLETEQPQNEEEVVAAAPAVDEDVVEVKQDETPKEEKPKRFVRTQDDTEVSEEELAKYSEEVQKRIKRLTWKSKNEQRGREQAERDRDEAVRIAQMLLEEKRKAERERDSSVESQLKEASQRIDIAIEAANQKLAEAFEAFDGSAVAKANAELARLMVQKERLAEQKPVEKPAESTRQDEKSRVESFQSPPQEARPDPLAEAWAKQNRWFQLDGYGRPSNDESAFALKVHETLLRNGIHPVLNAEEYYRKLDATMRRNFPEHFGEPPAKPAEKPVARPTVASVTRTPSGTQKIKLTQSQVAMANRLGVPVEEYAKQLAELRS